MEFMESFWKPGDHPKDELPQRCNERWSFIQAFVLFCSDWLCRLRFPCLAPSGVRLRTGLVSLSCMKPRTKAQAVGFRRLPVQPQVPAQRHEHPSLLKVQAEVAAYMERSTMIGHVFVSPSSRLYGGAMLCQIYPNLMFLILQIAAFPSMLIHLRVIKSWSDNWQPIGLITLLAWVKLVTQNQPFVGRYGPLVPQWLNPRSQVSNTYPTWSINIIVWLWNYYIIYII